MDQELVRVRRLAHVMDHFLVDPLMGLVLPGIGDALGSVIGFYIVAVAWRRRVSPVILARMILNLGLDLVVGVLPLVGDAFDFTFKANLRNADLLVQRSTGRATWRDWVVVGLAAAAYLAVMALVIWGVIAIVRAL
jgi:hypothetical protein